MPTSQINITNDQKRQLDASLAGANPDVFNKIQHSIFNLLETDCFPRFLDSDQYKEYEQGSTPFTLPTQTTWSS